jgi:hypothetical protein
LQATFVICIVSLSAITLATTLMVGIAVYSRIDQALTMNSICSGFVPDRIVDCQKMPTKQAPIQRTEALPQKSRRPISIRTFIIPPVANRGSCESPAAGFGLPGDLQV